MKILSLFFLADVIIGHYFAADNRWELIDAQGEGPGCLQEHSMVGYKDTIYVFGGEVGFSNGVETPLWKYNIAVRIRNLLAHCITELK